MTGLADRRYLLPSDVLVFPVRDLPASLQQRLESSDAHWAVTRPRARALSQLVDQDAAELLECFRSPTTLVDAVLSFAARRDADPEHVLANAYPLLTSFRRARLLVPADSGLAAPIVPTLGRGDRIGSVEVIRNVQVLDDSELYLGRLVESSDQYVAVKLLRPDAAAICRWQLDREAAVLELLAGRIAPRLIAAGEASAARKFLVTTWISGCDAETAAARARPDRNAALELVIAVLTAYAAIHEQGVLHGDVHPKNVLVRPDGTIALCDFGVARVDGSDVKEGLERAVRAGAGPFFEPEYAAPTLDGQPAPPTTYAGEQYALGALSYLLLTGATYAAFDSDSRAMLRQIATEPVRPFENPWPTIESVVAQALAKEPRDRFRSVAAFREALVEAGSITGDSGRRPRGRATIASILQSVVESLRPGSSPGSPPGSFTYGAAGAAFGLARLSVAKEDPELLALAEYWLAHAHSLHDEAFFDESVGISRRSVSPGAPHHMRTGVHLAHAVIAHLTSDGPGLGAAIDRFVSASSSPATAIDLTLGTAGSIVGSALLLELARSPSAPTLETSRPIEGVIGVGDNGVNEVCRYMNALPPIAEATQLPNPAIAHGWGGLLYAVLLWTRSRSQPVPTAVADRLEQLADFAEPIGRGLRWPLSLHDRTQGWMASWCNGAPGMTHLFIAAAERLPDARLTRLAEGCAWNAWDAPSDMAGICCGLAGRAYALAAMGRYTGDDGWHERSRRLAQDAVVVCRDRPFLPTSLYKGTLGVSVAYAELVESADNGRHARQPLFETEAW